MDITAATFKTNRISSRLAPASIAARMWRRGPTGLRFVLGEFKLILTSSINFADKTPSVQGFVVIFTHCSAQAGSHSRSLPSAASQGLVACSVTEAFAVPPSLAIFFLLSRPLRVLLLESILKPPSPNTPKV